MNMPCRGKIRLNLTAYAVFLALLMCVLATKAHAQTAVYIQSTAPDIVGRQLVFELREAVRRSAALSLAEREQDARIYARIVTLDPDNSGRGISTVYSAVITMQTFHETPVEMYLTSYVGSCGRLSVESCARSLLSDIDEVATNIRAMIRTMLDGMDN